MIFKQKSRKRIMLTANSSRKHKVNVNLQKTQFVRVILLHIYDEDRFHLP